MKFMMKLILKTPKTSVHRPIILQNFCHFFCVCLNIDFLTQRKSINFKRF